MKENSAVLEKSINVAVRIVKLHRYLCEEKKIFVLAEQILRSGTSIGANIHEAVYAQSRKDFVSKMSIALKEASESEYWLELLKRTEYITDEQYNSLQKDCGEIAKMLTAIVKTSKEK